MKLTDKEKRWYKEMRKAVHEVRACATCVDVYNMPLRTFPKLTCDTCFGTNYNRNKKPNWKWNGASE